MTFFSAPPVRSDAQHRADDIQAFRRELNRLYESRILSLDPMLHRAIERHHEALLKDFERAFEIDRDATFRQLSLGMRITSFLGALALALSLFFFFQYYWGFFGQAVQVFILIGAAVATFGATIWLQYSDKSGYFSKLAAMTAFAAFVINISMLGEIFNITPSDNALLVWAVYGFLLGYICDARLLLVAGIVCLMAFIGMRLGTWGGMYWLSSGERPESFIPAGMAVFMAPLFFNQHRFSGFATTYRIAGLIALFLPMLILANWGAGSYLMWSVDMIEGGYQILGFAVAALVIWLGIRFKWQDTVNTGVTFFTLFLYTKVFDWWWEYMPKYLFFMILSLIAILVLFMLRRLRRVLVLKDGGMQ